MKLKELNEMVNDEDRCEAYLRSVGILKTFTHCIGCGAEHPGIARGNRYCCYKCRKEWSRRKDSILSITRFSYSEFLICLKYFSLEFSAEATSEEFGLNYKTVRILFNLFRMKMGDVDEETIARFSGIIKGDTQTIGLNYKDGKVRFELDSSSPADVQVKAVRHRLQRSAAHYEFSYEKLKSELMNTERQGYISQLERFWRFATERFYSYRGTEQMYFIIFLKELEFRFNHQDENIFDAIVSKLAQN